MRYLVYISKSGVRTGQLDTLVQHGGTGAWAGARSVPRRREFYFVATGTTDNRTDITLDANLHASMGYETGLF